ncbi:MAG: OmpA family protein [Alphaproteobacteria bacterium]
MSKRKRKPPSGIRVVPDWMVTFGDITTLLTTFFVLIITFTMLDADRFDMIAGGLRGAFGIIKEDWKDDRTSLVDKRLLKSALRFPRASESVPDYEPLDRVERRIHRRLELLDMLELVELAHMERGLVIRIPDQLLFRSCSARLTRRQQPVLEEIAAALRYIANQLVVEGHTDDSFLPTSEFKSDIELALARAVAVTDRLADLGIAPRRMGTASAGAFKPLLPNTTPAGRARNRRVEITILPPPRREDES